MSRLEKLKSIRDAFFPLIKKHDFHGGGELDAMRCLQELISDEEIKDTLISNPARLAFPVSHTCAFYFDEAYLYSLSDKQRADFWEVQGICFGEKMKEQDALAAALKFKEEIIKNAAKDSSPFETFRTIYNTISSQNSAKEKKS